MGKHTLLTSTHLIHRQFSVNGPSTYIYSNDIFYDDKFKETVRVTPKKGSCIIFDIDLWHQGLEVKNGKKY